MAKRNDEEARTLSEVPIWRDTADHRRRTGNTPLGSKSGEWGWGSYSPQRVQLTAEEDKTQRDHVRPDATRCASARIIELCFLPLVDTALSLCGTQLKEEGPKALRTEADGASFPPGRG
jgi:hypothetical protein